MNDLDTLLTNMSDLINDDIAIEEQIARVDAAINKSWLEEYYGESTSASVENSDVKHVHITIGEVNEINANE